MVFINSEFVTGASILTAAGFHGTLFYFMDFHKFKCSFWGWGEEVFSF